MSAAFTPLVFADLAINNADDLVFGVAPPLGETSIEEVQEFM